MRISANNIIPRIVLINHLLWDMDCFGSPSEVVGYCIELVPYIMNRSSIMIVNIMSNYICRDMTPGNGKSSHLLR